MGWIGVDLDGTLAHYDGWKSNHLSIGAPVPKMLGRVLTWLVGGKDVRIVTARVSPANGDAFVTEQTAAIEAWCLEHVGQVLPVTSGKDFGLLELWDDLAVQVEMNTGRRVDGQYEE